jgi:hypothetical protein
MYTSKNSPFPRSFYNFQTKDGVESTNTFLAQIPKQPIPYVITIATNILATITEPTDIDIHAAFVIAGSTVYGDTSDYATPENHETVLKRVAQPPPTTFHTTNLPISSE